MAIKLVRSAGDNIDAAVVDMYASGVVKPNSAVEFSRTGGVGVFPASASSPFTSLFGVCLDYAQGASDVMVRVIKFEQNQLWEVDAVNAITTAQIGLRHQLNDHLSVRNTGTDLGAGTASTAVFRAIAITGLTTGSAKLIGYFRTSDDAVGQNQTTFA